MAQVFPRWTNRLPLFVATAGLGAVLIGTGFMWYFGSPLYTDVGYRPQQPVEYSHKLHAGDLGIDCRYCHVSVESSSAANIPPTQTCMNCHTLVLPESKKLAPVRESFIGGLPIQWIRVHDVPDYAYFDHSIHIDRGVGCITCHGNVAQMDVVTLKKPLSMSWCLDCHRNPADHLRPADEVTNMNWVAPANQREMGAKIIADHKIKAPVEDCSGCHR